MQHQNIEEVLDHILNLPHETEYVEFKTATTNFDSKKLGKYFSALSNEANLCGKQCGWLVFGVDNDHNICGTKYKENPQSLDSLKHAVAQHTSEKLTFVDIHVLFPSEKRVILFEIPPALPGIPTKWKGHAWGRDGESLVALNDYEIDQIRRQSTINDWSAEICERASLDVLDPQALEQAKKLFKEKHTNLVAEIDGWNDAEFLNRTKLTIQGNLTNATIILLGKPESVLLLSPSIAQITWILKDETDIEKDYIHFGPPLLLNVDALYARLRNLTVRQLPYGTLFPREIKQYDQWVVREALHNCIAHQDYSMNHKIVVVEKPGEVIFANSGTFLPGDIESLLTEDTPPRYYRNQFLADAMVNLNMIDTVGSGIRRMYREQMKRSFPLPDYDLTNPNSVTVRITGQILNDNYTRLLLNNEDLKLKTVILLDKVQKGIRISNEEHKKLKRRGLVEGRYPNIYVCSEIAAATKRKSDYVKYRSLDDRHYKELILSLIKEFGSASRSDIDNLLTKKLSDALDEGQKKNKIHNLLLLMSRQDKIIINIGSRKEPKWVLTKNSNE